MFAGVIFGLLKVRLWVHIYSFFQKRKDKILKFNLLRFLYYEIRVTLFLIAAL